MRGIFAILAFGLILGPISAGESQAQTNDHLKCYQVKGDLKLKGTVDIETLQFGLEPGCKIKKAKFFCAPATKSGVDVVNPKTKQPITPLPFSAAPAPGDRICWKVKCPEPFPSDQVVTDQFGTQTLTKFKTKFLCTPAVKGTEFCGDGSITGTEECEPTDDSACPGLCQPNCTCDGSVSLTCGDGVKNGNDDCDGNDLGGETCESLGFQSGTLACSVGCGLDVSGCIPFTPDPNSAPLLATGQTRCWDSSGAQIACAGTGHDGEIQAGTVFDYVDNGDGTITDLNTGLLWEKKSDDGTIHDKDTTYSWDDAFAVHVATLNSSTFAGHTDWRVPNVRELQSIVDYGRFDPSVDLVFDTGCAPGCTVLTCSCTANNFYWSSSTDIASPTRAWDVNFDADFFGSVNINFKTSTDLVRAVRGGL